MDEEYKKMIRENFVKFIKDIEDDYIIIGAMYFPWLEATKQIDERNKCLNSVYQMAIKKHQKHTRGMNNE